MTPAVVVVCRCLGCAPNASANSLDQCENNADGEDGLCQWCRSGSPKWLAPLVVSVRYPDDSEAV